jgi:tripartite-type tricarboxylate transporter receptor subunit TctC
MSPRRPARPISDPSIAAPSDPSIAAPSDPVPSATSSARPASSAPPAAARRRALQALAACALAPSAATPALAQDTWPGRPVKVIVPQGVGSGSDIVGRVFADLLTQAFRQPFVVDNRAGANGMLGTQAAMKAPPDGYTLLFTYAAAQVVNQSLYEKAGYDGAKDFAPIAQIGSGGNVLVVRSDFPAKDLKGFIAYAKARPPEDLAYGSWGPGSGGHLSMEALAQQAGLKLRHVPYKSTAASNQDIVAGHIQAGFSSVQAALPLIQAGRLQALAISGTHHTDALPELRTMTEQGIVFDLDAWYGVFAPLGTPAPIVERLNREINRIQAAPENAERWKTLGFSAMPLKSPKEFADSVRRDVAAWGAIVRSANIKVE